MKKFRMLWGVCMCVHVHVCVYRHMNTQSLLVNQYLSFRTSGIEPLTPGGGGDTWLDASEYSVDCVKNMFLNHQCEHSIFNIYLLKITSVCSMKLFRLLVHPVIFGLSWWTDFVLRLREHWFPVYFNWNLLLTCWVCSLTNNLNIWLSSCFRRTDLTSECINENAFISELTSKNLVFLLDKLWIWVCQKHTR